MAIPVDTIRFQPVATGNISPIPVWKEVKGGTNERTDVQASNDSGIPLWSVEILRDTESFGQKKMVPTSVTVPSATLPEIPLLTAIKFEGLEVDFFVSKGQIRERWQAESIRLPSAATQK